MNNKIPKESVLKKKGFYAALYSCVGVLLVIAAVMSFNNYTQAKKQQQGSEQSQVDVEQVEGVSKSQDKSYLTPQDKAAVEKAVKQAEPAITPAAKPTTAPAKPEVKPQVNTPKPTAAPVVPVTPPAAAPAAPQQQKPASPQSVAPEAQPNAPESQASGSDASLSPGQATLIEPVLESDETAVTGAESSPLTVEEGVAATTADPVESLPVFNPFADGKKMSWPVVGEILMDFSSDHAIYDKTLDQYRTNSNICISSELGAQVHASAEGVVKKVTKTVEDGNMVVIDNGNGWTSTYSQLQDGVLVREGDVVKEGQVIGGISSPSIYSVLLGNHLEFSLTKDDAPVDPKSVLVSN